MTDVLITVYNSVNSWIHSGFIFWVWSMYMWRSWCPSLHRQVTADST